MGGLQKWDADKCSQQRIGYVRAGQNYFTGYYLFLTHSQWEKNECNHSFHLKWIISDYPLCLTPFLPPLFVHVAAPDFKKKSDLLRFNLYTYSENLLILSLMCFDKYIQSWERHHNEERVFPSPPNTPSCPCAVNLHPLPLLGKKWSDFCVHGFGFLECRVSGTTGDASGFFYLAKRFWDLPWSCLDQEFVPFCSWIVFYSMKVPQFIHLPADKHLSCFQVLAIMKKKTKKTSINLC